MKEQHVADMMAMELWPKDAPHLTPLAIYGDGNCLPRCLSLLAYDTQDNHPEMRVRIFAEMVLGMDHYLQHPCLAEGNDNKKKAKDIPKIYASNSEHYMGQVLTPNTISTIFKEEAMTCLKPNTEMGMWQVHCVASILGTPLSCIYPLYGGYTARPDMNRTVLPRCVPFAPAPFQAGIMWTHTQGKNDSRVTAKTWRPNHFVACVPDEVSLLEISVSTLDRSFVDNSSRASTSVAGPSFNNSSRASTSVAGPSFDNSSRASTSVAGPSFDNSSRASTSVAGPSFDNSSRASTSVAGPSFDNSSRASTSVAGPSFDNSSRASTSVAGPSFDNSSRASTSVAGPSFDNSSRASTSVAGPSFDNSSRASTSVAGPIRPVRVGDFVEVKLQPISSKKSRPQFFVGLVEHVVEGGVEVQFLKKGSGGSYVWPDVPEHCFAVTEEIGKVLPPPTIDRHFFNQA